MLAITTLYLVSVGTSVVTQGKRRMVDPHWFRDASYLKIGWHWVIGMGENTSVPNGIQLRITDL